MRNGLRVSVALAALIVLSSGLVLSQEGPPPQIAPIDMGEMIPNGCVSCHLPAVQGPDGTVMDVRLSVLLPQVVEDHPNFSGDVATTEIPGLCVTCHDGDPAPELANTLHHYHYRTPPDRDNHFVSMFGGQCMMCHALDVDTGVITVKSGFEVTPE